MAIRIERVATTEELGRIATRPMLDAVVVIGVARFERFERDVLSSGVGVACGRQGAALIALVGEAAERAHDALDDALVDEQLLDVTTTWHSSFEPGDVADTVWAVASTSEIARILAVLDHDSDVDRRVAAAIATAIARPAAGRSDTP